MRMVITAAYDYLGRRAWKTIATNAEIGEETATIALRQRECNHTNQIPIC